MSDSLDKHHPHQTHAPRVICIAGGPGSGKGTQCRWLEQTFRLQHISIGDILRDEMNRPSSPYADIIRQNMMAGTIGPKEVTLGVLKSHVLRSMQHGTNVFLLDGEYGLLLVLKHPANRSGFPRNLEQVGYFEEAIGQIELVVLLKCSEDVLVDRLLQRGRFDDSDETIRGRLETFNEATSRIIEVFESRGRLKVIDGERTVAEVSEQLRSIFSGSVDTR
ncbi:hypothetical protein F66182_9231 [Fusarium sp. NRRL 66182]|nr:hypothetical protein F66182_9231 [Fusarium sp. NRRL 66182]